MINVDVDVKREATASIRGYLYQIDATIKEIVNSELDDQIIIEGIEDFDKYSEQDIVYSQVKYYSGSNLTNSILREPLFKLFSHYIGLSDKSRDNRKYVLYGHYTSINIPLNNISNELFKEVMKYTKNLKDENGNEYTKEFSKLNEVSCDDSLINAFCSCFEIKPSSDYETHRNEVIKAIAKQFSLNLIESKSFHYPNIFNYVANKAANSDHLERIITKNKIKELINSCETVHHHWLLREKDVIEYGAIFRRMYFESYNIAGVERFFVIEISPHDTDSDIFNQIINISKKWSSQQVKRMSNKDRFSPFIMLRGLSESRVLDIKHSLFDSGFKFVDGFPYKGSLFRNDYLTLQPTAEIYIPFRFVDCEESFISALQSIVDKRCLVYDFYYTSPLNISVNPPRKQKISIPIKNIPMLEHIV